MLAGPVVDHAGGAGRYFGVKGERIGFQEDIAVAGQDFELVQLTLAQAGHKQFPNPRAWPQPHRVAAAIPAVEGADDADPLGVRCPYREVDAGQTGHLAGMRSQLFENLVVVALGE